MRIEPTDEELQNFIQQRNRQKRLLFTKPSLSESWSDATPAPPVALSEETSEWRQPPVETGTIVKRPWHEGVEKLPPKYQPDPVTRVMSEFAQLAVELPTAIVKNVLESAKRGVMHPGEVLQGKASPYDVEKAFDTASLVGGGGAAGLSAGKAEISALIKGLGNTTKKSLESAITTKQKLIDASWRSKYGSWEDFKQSPDYTAIVELSKLREKLSTDIELSPSEVMLVKQLAQDTLDKMPEPKPGVMSEEYKNNYENIKRELKDVTLGAGKAEVSAAVRALRQRSYGKVDLTNDQLTTFSKIVNEELDPQLKQIITDRIYERINLGVREVTATEPSRVATWSNTYGKWYLSPNAVKKGQKLRLDANHILVPAKQPQLVDAWFELQEAPALPLYGGSFERTKMGKKLPSEDLVPPETKVKSHQAEPLWWATAEQDMAAMRKLLEESRGKIDDLAREEQVGSFVDQQAKKKEPGTTLHTGDTAESAALMSLRKETPTILSKGQRIAAGSIDLSTALRQLSDHFKGTTASDNSIDHDSHPQGAKASWYGKDFHGKLMSNKQRFDMNKMTAAHRKLPFGTKVRVTDKHTGKNVVVEITDRGPYKYSNRVIDLSKAAAEKLGILQKGTANIKLDIIEKARKQPPHIKVSER